MKLFCKILCKIQLNWFQYTRIGCIVCGWWKCQPAIRFSHEFFIAYVNTWNNKPSYKCKPLLILYTLTIVYGFPFRFGMDQSCRENCACRALRTHYTHGNASLLPLFNYADRWYLIRNYSLLERVCTACCCDSWPEMTMATTKHSNKPFYRREFGCRNLKRSFAFYS